MRVVLLLVISLFVCFPTSSPPVAAQLPPVQTDPLSKQVIGIQGANACSATEASSCAEVASKILPQVMGPSPMEGNLRRLTDEIGGRLTRTPQMATRLDRALSALRAARIEGHIEK